MEVELCLRFPGGLLGTLRAGSGGERGDIDAGARERAGEFLAPVGDIARRAVAVEHAQRSVAGIGQLVKDLVRDVDGLPRVQGGPFFPKAHFGRSAGTARPWPAAAAMTRCGCGMWPPAARSGT